MLDGQLIHLKKDQILFLAGDVNNDLFIIQKGKVLVFVQNGSQIIPVAYLSPGEYIGEFSFFDNHPRSASIICIEDTDLKKISAEVMNNQLPNWLKTIGNQLSLKIRDNDELIRLKGIRKNKVESIKPLSIEEQTHCFKIVETHRSKLLGSIE